MCVRPRAYMHMMRPPHDNHTIITTARTFGKHWLMEMLISESAHWEFRWVQLNSNQVSRHGLLILIQVPGKHKTPGTAPLKLNRRRILIAVTFGWASTLYWYSQVTSQRGFNKKANVAVNEMWQRFKAMVSHQQINVHFDACSHAFTHSHGRAP